MIITFGYNMNENTLSPLLPWSPPGGTNKNTIKHYNNVNADHSVWPK